MALVDAQAMGGYAVPVRVEIGVKGGVSWRADGGGGGKGRVETHSSCGQGVYMGRLTDAVEAVATSGVEALLVGHQDDYIGVFGHGISLAYDR